MLLTVGGAVVLGVIIIVGRARGIVRDIYSAAFGALTVAGVYHFQHLSLIGRSCVEESLVDLDRALYRVTLPFAVVLAHVFDRDDAWDWASRSFHGSTLQRLAPEHFGAFGTRSRSSFNPSCSVGHGGLAMVLTFALRLDRRCFGTRLSNGRSSGRWRVGSSIN